ncbi:glycoside hydrolase family 97 protein [Thermomonas fusca]|uniref:Glycoside hydrolase family 97 protein n=1 Tax=Thermomonas fusca TaxID=215690 RepID=A0A5R9PBD3_9GAMM|nr:glycoside hydrolase family 97 protein [Thermomonas fusca]TLX20841.1 glycoside hydrolase family 97 protein [Thermomonas fusca]
MQAKTMEMPVRVSLLAIALVLALPGGANAEQVAQVKSPDGRIEVQLDLNGEGRLAYRVLRDGKPVLKDSRLGFIFRNGRQLLRNLALDKQAQRSADHTWEQPWGERRYVRDHYNELRAGFVEKDGDHRRFDMVFRVFDDGIGFRYDVPAQPALREAQIVQELTEFAVARPATAWWIPALEWNREEYLYHRTPLSGVGVVQTPITLRTDDGLHLSIHEAALVDYAGMNLMRGGDGELRALLTPGSPAPVVRKTPFVTPWRTITLGERAGALVESNLILNLNEPNALGDVGWFKPSKYVGVWWSLHLDKESWATGPRHGATTANTKRYIDFAAANGFRGVLVEGWNVGWDGDWFANGWGFDFSKPTPDYDLAALARYAGGKGVHLIGHHETACAVSHYERQMDAAFAKFAALGIDAVKTGYVCDAGQIERQDAAGAPVLREWHEGQWMSNHHLRVVRDAARHHVAINAHEPIKDTGLRRTYPNWISREGARGMEFNAWGNPPNPPEHEVTLVFTRLLAGPMDYTPGIVSLTGRNGQEIQSTLARQLALYVGIYSPIQMVADLPEHYAAHPEAFRFIRDVAVDWDESKVLAGEVGEYVAIARKARGKPEWFVGAMNDRNPRTLALALDFLEPGKRYRAQIYRDGEGASFQGDARFRFVSEEKTVARGDVLSLWLAGGGGAAVRLLPVVPESSSPAAP